MLYKTLLDKVIKFVDAEPGDPGSQTVRALAKITGKNLQGYVSQFDVREIGNLRTIIPNAFPRVLRTGPLVGDQNIHGSWRIQSISRLPNSRYKENVQGFIL